MPVVSVVELPRKEVFEINKGYTELTREWVCILGDDTLAGSPATTAEMVTALGWNTAFIPHPHAANYYIRKVTLTEGYEGSPYHVHVKAEYGFLFAWEALPPADRPYAWEFEATAGEVAAYTYYDGNTIKPLTNSAFDFFPGLTAPESLGIARVTGNFSSFPSAWIGAQNHVNNGSYLGVGMHTIKVASVKVVPAFEQSSTWSSYVVVGPGGVSAGSSGGASTFWKATAELHYRQSGHNLQLPDVGWNYLNGGQKRRAMVFDFENDEWVASTNPVGLDGNGGQTLGMPAILNRRVNPQANFQALFGTPPTTAPAFYS